MREGNTLRWTRGRAMPNVPDVMTRRNVFSMCGNISACVDGFIKRRENTVKKDEVIKLATPQLKQMIKENCGQSVTGRSCPGDWCVNGSAINVWVNANSLATGVLLEKMDQCWKTHASFGQQPTPSILTCLN